MKKSSFTALLIVIFTFVASSQSRIDGIGKFRLGATTEEVKEILVEVGRTAFNISDFSEIPVVSNDREKLGKFCMQFKQNEDSTFSDAPLVKNEDIFYIDICPIVDKISLYSLYLHFYNDSLYCISGGFSDFLIDGFKLKYGEPKEERKVDYSGGIEAIDESWEWGTGIPSVMCRAVRMFRYNTIKNEPLPGVNRFSIWDTDIQAKVSQEEQKIKERLENKKRADWLKELEAL